ncbi:MAG: DUF4838 domain-containing protein [Verrucomicrobia bacterium]|nr:DUF4838 domain-containing protein [Verrucomicrobiota bacterium]
MKTVKSEHPFRGFLFWAMVVFISTGVRPIVAADQTNQTIVIGFEEKEGFPAKGGDFTGSSTDEGAVSAWRNKSKVPNRWFTDGGPRGVKYPEAPSPISGKQIGGFGGGGSGLTSGAMELDKKATLALTSFYWAYRGNGDSRPGGNACLELEYFNLSEKSLGKQKFQGGLNPDWTPKLDRAEVASEFQAVPLSKVIFRGVPPDPAAGQGTFFLDDLTLAKRKPKPMLALIKDGQPSCTIVIPKEKGVWTPKAAQWLKEYIFKATGVDLNIFSEDQAPSGTLISVGHTQIAEQAGISIADLKWDGCRLIVRGDVLYLIGRDSPKENKEAPLRIAKGTARAVVTFLEDICGVRWFLPGPEGELVPKVTDISVPEDLAKTVIPDFAISDGRSPYDEKAGSTIRDVGFLAEGGGTPASIANNYRVGIPANTGGQNFPVFVPAGKHFKDHPEYFALIQGKRTGEGNHLCTSHPEVRKIILQEIRNRFDQGYEYVSLGQEDGYVRCECAECEKSDNYRGPRGDWEKFMMDPEGLVKTPCERLFLLYKWVADELKKSHPDKKLAIMAYAPTCWPSKKIERWPDNVVVEINHPETEVIAAWKDKVSAMGVVMVHWFNITLPMGMLVHHTPKEAAEHIRYLHDNKFIGFYQFEETNWGLQGPVFHAVGKLMGNVNADPNALVEEYCRGVYGNAADPMLQFFNLLHTRHEGLLTYDQKLGPIRHPRSMSPTDLTLLYYPPSHLNQLEQLLRKAEREADTDRARGWLRLTRDHFDYIKLITFMLISYRAYETDPTHENWLAVRKKVEAFEKYRMKIISYDVPYVERWFPGHDHFCNYLTANAQHERNIYYVPWQLRKPEVLKKGVKGAAVGYGGTFGYNYIKEPLTLDFSKPPKLDQSGGTNNTESSRFH